MKHNFVLLVVLATFKILDYHSCNGQVSTPITLLPSPCPPPPSPPPPAGVRLSPPPPPLTRSSDPYNCCFDPYHCCDHDDSRSGIDILLVVLVGAILVVLILFSIFFVYNLCGFRQFVVAIGAGLTNVIHAINENLVKSVNGVAGAINSNLGANGPINKSLTAIDGKLGAIDGRLAAIPGPLLEISSRLENICPNCKVYLTVLPCKCGGSTCECGGSLSSPCRCI